MLSPARNQIGDWQDDLHRLEYESKVLVEGLSEQQFNWRPGPERWSVGECFNHLAIATGLMLDKVKPVLERGHVDGITGMPPFGYKLLGGWFVGMMQKPPGKRSMASPKNFVPPSGMPKSQVMQNYFAVLHELGRALERSHGLALDRLKAASAAKGGSWLKFNLAAWFAATIAHLSRHLAQARRVMAAYSEEHSE